MNNILIVENDSKNVTLLKKILGETKYNYTVAFDGNSALEKVNDSSLYFDAILLDLNLPGVNGLDILQALKQNSQKEKIPVIIQSSVTDQNIIQKGLDLGAYYYLTKPYEAKQMLALVKTAIREHIAFQALQKSALKGNKSNSPLIEEGKFLIKNINEFELLLSQFAYANTDYEAMKLGVSEIIKNSIEHGNLEIDYDEKSKLLESNTWEEEIKYRSQHEKYKYRFVTIEFKSKRISNSNNIELLITDEGKGFEWEKYLDFDVERIFDIHGRGIAKAKFQYFKTLQYRESGNIVYLEI